MYLRTDTRLNAANGAVAPTHLGNCSCVALGRYSRRGSRQLLHALLYLPHPCGRTSSIPGVVPPAIHGGRLRSRHLCVHAQHKRSLRYYLDGFISLRAIRHRAARPQQEWPVAPCMQVRRSSHAHQQVHVGWFTNRFAATLQVRRSSSGMRLHPQPNSTLSPRRSEREVRRFSQEVKLSYDFIVVGKHVKTASITRRKQRIAAKCSVPYCHRMCHFNELALLQQLTTVRLSPSLSEP